MISQIRKLSQKVGADADLQYSRLKIFEERMKMASETPESHIPDSDNVFLKKEVARYHASIATLKASNAATLKDSNQISDENSETPGRPVSVEDLQRLKNNLKSLVKKDSVDVPRIKRSIDELEIASLKSLKN